MAESLHIPDAGLLKMCVDITKSLFRNLASEGVVLSEAVLKTLRATYLQSAQEAITRYQNDAAINSLQFDRHADVAPQEGLLFAAGIVPVVQALLGKGAALGTVLAFMMSVIALSLPEMIILRKVLKVRLIATFVGVVGLGILIVGYLFNMII